MGKGKLCTLMEAYMKEMFRAILGKDMAFLVKLTTLFIKVIGKMTFELAGER